MARMIDLDVAKAAVCPGCRHNVPSIMSGDTGTWQHAMSEVNVRFECLATKLRSLPLTPSPSLSLEETKRANSALSPEKLDKLRGAQRAGPGCDEAR